MTRRTRLNPLSPLNALNRRDLLALTAATAAMPLAAAQSRPDLRRDGDLKVLRYAFEIAETGFDPAQISDTYSRTITPHIFEALYGYDYLARPVQIKPLTAVALPEVSEDFRTWTIKVRPGIYFSDDPAFQGQRRELTAHDYVYSFKRFADPAIKAQAWASLEENRLIGLAEARRRALDSGKPFDYDAPVEGVRALDRYTLQFKLALPRPRFLQLLAQSDLFGAVAREVVERYREDIMAHPVGTGPFVLKAWRRSSHIVLERNPGYRERLWDAEPAADDAEGQAIAARLRGKRLPLIDRVEIDIIEESQPRWLSFLNAEHDLMYNVPPEFINVALPNNRLAPNLAARGMQLYHVMTAENSYTFFNMEHPVIGGYTPEKVALRRAISLGMDIEREIRNVRRGQGVIAQSHLMPHTFGFDPAYKSSLGDYNPARANALLDLYGYKDINRDGWRERPDGSPLVIEVATQPDSLSRQYDELWQRNLTAIGLRPRFFPGKWPEQLKAARSGQLMLWFLGISAASPDGQGALDAMYGPQSGNQNLARFKLPAFDAIYERLAVLPDGPERNALFHEAKRIQAAYMPIKTHIHRYRNDITHPWLIGFRRPLFRNEFWHFVDIDPSVPRQR